MLTDCKTPMAVKDSEDSTSLIVGYFIDVAICIFHLRPKFLISIFCLGIFSNAGAINNMNTHIKLSESSLWATFILVWHLLIGIGSTSPCEAVGLLLRGLSLLTTEARIWCIVITCTVK